MKKIISSLFVLTLLTGCGITINTSSSTQPASTSDVGHSQLPNNSLAPSRSSTGSANEKSTITSSSPQLNEQHSSNKGSSSSTSENSSNHVTHSSIPSTNHETHSSTTPTSHTAVVATSWTQGIWYPNQTYAPIAFVIPLPNSWGPFVQQPNPYRPWGSYWSSRNNMQIAISLLPYSLQQMSHAAPNGATLLVSGGNEGAWSMIWRYPNGIIDANEMVFMGTREYGWKRAIGGNESSDNTFLMNVTLPDSPANLVTAEDILAHWSLQDMQNGRTWAGQHSGFSFWLPQWPLNPLQNSNEPAMPYWLRHPGSYQ
ncbi:hypothetical protein [Sulfobacillus thermosulfidooxidans]|uniref:hypothetical protein n=1 Tax=Sulfobacillus thermosulfidooxidans TaxID=28034 RepID=UPI000ADC0AA6|nr:hypothetical protein [Sulfobacillus thermosulfidooxidans]